MRVLVTGDKGYIGSVLVPALVEQGHEVIGFDAGFFDDCNIEPTFEDYKQIRKDIRDISEEDMSDVDAIIHLAGLSNDPLGELSPGITEQINLDGTLRAAKIAKDCGVSRFIFSSSQSLYGISKTDLELDEDLSLKDPITAYAISKWKAELELIKLNSTNFTTTYFRPSTVFGASPRLRCDIVYNSLIASGYTTNKIEVKSDGTPWRPIVHVKDVCSAYIAGLVAEKEVVSGRSFNVGVHGGNYSVRQLAEAAQEILPESLLKFTGEHGQDSRSYRVSFDRILRELFPHYNPVWGLLNGGQEIIELFERVGFNEMHFRGVKCNRLAKLNELIECGFVNGEMRVQ